MGDLTTDDWRALITDAYAEFADARRPVLQPPASEQALQEVERALGFRLPAELRALLASTNGVLCETPVLGRFQPDVWVLWHCDWMSQLNLDMREYDSDATARYVFFSSDGSDLEYGIAIAPEASREVIVFDPIMDEVDPFAPSLAEFFRKRARGETQ